MKVIPLTQGKFAKIDDDDFRRVSQWKWCAINKGGGRFYAGRQIGKRPFRKLLRMQNLIMPPLDGFLVDHIDGNTLNNCRSNLRLASELQNLRNRKLGSKNTSGFKGVWLHRKSNQWVARIGVNYKYLFLGMFDDKKEAARAYDMAAEKHFGEFAKTNAMMGLF